MQGSLFLMLLVAAATSNLFVSAATVAKVGEACSKNADCDAGLHCESCVQPHRCTRTSPTDPQSKVKGLPFNKYSWLTTHNSFAIRGQGSRVDPVNQEDTITSQLNNGIRGLMLDMYDYRGDVWLCHSFDGKCFEFTAFRPAVDVLREVAVFLDRHPDQIVTIFIEDYVKAPMGLTKVFDAAGLRKYWYPVDSMPARGGDWPLIGDMIARNHRLLVFTSDSGKAATEGIAHQWDYVVENQFGDDGMNLANSCRNRGQSSPMNSLTESLVLMNFFPDLPVMSFACVSNSGLLFQVLGVCHRAAANRWPNYIAVDYYMRSNGNGAAGAVDIANGQMLCGRGDVSLCQSNATFAAASRKLDLPAVTSSQVAGDASLPIKLSAPSPEPAPASGQSSGGASPKRELTQWVMWIATMALPLLSKLLVTAVYGSD